MKYVVLLLVLLVAFGALWLGRRRGEDKSGQPPRARGKATSKTLPTQFVACVHCGLHLPKGEAQFDAGGQPFCGPEHLRLGPRR
jgi:uncharacterized protein